MTTVGNICLLLAGLVYLALSSTLFSRQPPPGGDQGMSYAWMLVLGNAAFTLFLTIAVAIIASKGGFSWVARGETSRFVTVAGGYLLIMLAYNFFAFKEGMNDLPPPLRYVLAYYLPGLLPPFLLICAAILLNEGWRSVVPVAVYKWPLLLTAALGLLPLSLIIGQRARNAAAAAKARVEFMSRNDQAQLDQIDSTDVQAELVTLLVFTDANHRTETRNRALAKIKSRADWQEELVRLLQTDWAPQVFTFLASNEVDDKSLFAQPLETGIQVQAGLIRESILNCSGAYELYPDRFRWEVERLLRSVEKFRDTGVDYRPAVQTVRSALDEPTAFEKPPLEVTRVLDKWLRKN